MTIGTAFAVIWVAFTVATCAALVPVVIWGVKTRQFSKQDHVRYLPLECSMPRDSGEDAEQHGSGGDVSA